jgi:predicted permease
MLLARAAERRPEMAVRVALGAGRGQIVRQLLIESLLLAALGGLGAILAARWGLTALAAAFGTALVPADALRVDHVLLLFGLAACVVTGIGFGLAPAVDLARTSAGVALSQWGRSGTPSRHTARLQSALTLGEVAAAVVLLVSGGVLVLALQRMQAVDVGFRPDHVLTAELSARGVAASPDGRTIFFETVLSRVAAEPGVLAAAAVNWPPMTSDTVRRYTTSGGASRPPITAGYRVATPDYARAMGLTVRQGRFLSAADRATSPRVAVVNAAMAARAWPGEAPIGRQIASEDPSGRAAAPVTVVGVVDDVRHLGPGREPEPEVFVPLAQEPAESLYLAVRTAGDPGAFAPTLSRLVGDTSRDAPLSLVRPMTQVLADFLASGRTMATLVALFAAVALLVAATGLLGVIGCVAGQRTREFGIRMALGARWSALLWLLLRRALLLAAGGLLLGAAGGAAVIRILRATLTDEIRPEPAIFGAVAVIVAVVALGASVLPLARVLRRDPLLALRDE